MGAPQFGVKLVEIGELSQTNDLDSRAVKILVISGQHNARTVNLRGKNPDLGKLLGGVGDGQVGFLSQLFKTDGKLFHKGRPFQNYMCFYYTVTEFFCTVQTRHKNLQKQKNRRLPTV